MTSTRRRRPTLDDVAEAVGVSRATVSNAYNRPDQLSAPLRERVLRAAKELGYAGPNPTARSLATSRTGAIAVLLDTSLSTAFSDPALSVTLDALARAVDPGGHALLLLPGGDPRGGPPAERVLAAQADIAVAYSLADGTPALDAVRERGLPLVVIDQPLLPGTARIGCQDRLGAALAARHLLELGHRRFGIFAAASRITPGGGLLTADQGAAAAFRDTRERLAGYLEVLLPATGAAGVSVDSGAAGLAGSDAAALSGPGRVSGHAADLTTAGDASGHAADLSGPGRASGHTADVSGPGGASGHTADVSGPGGASGHTADVSGPGGASGHTADVSGPGGASGHTADVSGPGGASGHTADVSGPGGASGHAADVSGPGRLSGHAADLPTAGVDGGAVGATSGVVGLGALAGAADVVIEEAAGLSAESAMAGAFALLGRTPRPTALLCMSDQLALAAIAVARQLWIRVPEELSVVGFDDTSVAGWSEPPLTTVRQDLAAKGRIAGELVLRLLAGASPAAPPSSPPLPPPPPDEVPVELVVRASTARA